MIKLFYYLKHLIKSKRLNVFVLFFCIAFGILLITKLSQDYTNTVSFNIELKSIPDNVIIIEDLTKKELNVSFTQNGFGWLNYVFTTPKLVLDVEKYAKVTENTFVFGTNASKNLIVNELSKNVTNIQLNEEELKFTYDTYATKYVKVELDSNISFFPGFDVATEIKPQPDSVKLIGPEQFLKDISLVKTETLILNDVKEDINTSIALRFNTVPNSVKMNLSSVDVKTKVSRFTEGKLKLPISLINAPKDKTITYFPKTVTVYFYTTLQDFKTVKASQFKVICDYNKSSASNNFLVPELIRQPKDIKSARLIKQKIDFIINE